MKKKNKATKSSFVVCVMYLLKKLFVVFVVLSPFFLMFLFFVVPSYHTANRGNTRDLDWSGGGMMHLLD